MRFFVLFLILSQSAFAAEFCFPTQRLAYEYSSLWRVKAKMLMYKLLYAGKPATLVQIENGKKCDNCLVVTGDAYIIGVLSEEFEEKRKEFEKMIEERPVSKDLKVDVSMGKVYPDQKTDDKVFFNKQYVPFLRYPGNLQNVFYDREGEPIYVSAELRNPEIIIYTFIYKDMRHKIISRVNDPVGCMFPYDEETKKKYPLLQPDHYEKKFYMKEDDKMLPIKHFEILSIKRDFYWPQERIFQSN